MLRPQEVLNHIDHLRSIPTTTIKRTGDRISYKLELLAHEDILEKMDHELRTLDFRRIDTNRWIHERELLEITIAFGEMIMHSYDNPEAFKDGVYNNGLA